MPDPITHALALHQAGRLDEAVTAYQKIIAQHPQHADAWHLLGLVLHQSGQFTAAAECIESAIQYSVGPGLYYNSLGVVLMHLERHAEAEAAYRSAIERGPATADMWRNLANVLRVQDRRDEAIASYREALNLAPDQALTHNDLGVAFQAQGHLSDAAAAYRRATELQPDLAEAWSNLGTVFNLARDGQAAAACFQRSLALNPQDVTTLNNFGNVLRDSGKTSEAESCYTAALALKPDFAECHNNLGMLLRETGCLDHAIRAFRVAISYAPAFVTAHRNLLTTLLYQCDLSQEQLYAAHRDFASACVPAITPIASAPKVEGGPNKPLRVGWLSSDIRDHPVARNIAPLLHGHDRARFKYVLYTDAPLLDTVGAELHACVAEVHPIYALSDAQVAERIRADEIDILIILAGHFDHNRPLVAAYRSAPLQISFHDAATSGLDAMGYLISDRVMSPRGGAEYFTERVVRLPTFYIHAPLASAPEVTPLPALANSYITFANFGNPAKINSATLALWSQVLVALPRSRLMLKYKQAYQDVAVRQYFEAEFARHGIECERLLWHGSNMDSSEHLAFYQHVDITLDSFPFNGSTTTFESLWMGVPVLTLIGENMVGRWGASMLRSAGLSEWIAPDASEFIERALRFSADSAGLARLRGALREQIAASPLCNVRARTRQFERILRTLWRRKCQEA